MDVVLWSGLGWGHGSDGPFNIDRTGFISGVQQATSSVCSTCTHVFVRHVDCSAQCLSPPGGGAAVLFHIQNKCRFKCFWTRAGAFSAPKLSSV